MSEARHRSITWMSHEPSDQIHGGCHGSFFPKGNLRRQMAIGQNDRINIISAVQALPCLALTVVRLCGVIVVAGQPHKGRNLHQESVTACAGHWPPPYCVSRTPWILQLFRPYKGVKQNQENGSMAGRTIPEGEGGKSVPGGRLYPAS